MKLNVMLTKWTVHVRHRIFTVIYSVQYLNSEGYVIIQMQILWLLEYTFQCIYFRLYRKNG